jgi:hypothetical protein
MIVPLDNVVLAAEMAAFTKSGVYPYGKVVRTHAGERKQYIEHGELPGRNDGLPEGGALVLSRQGFIETCGYPQINYGEDNMFHNAIRCFLGPISRIWEPAHHLWHPESNTYHDDRVLQYVRATEHAVSDPDGMRRLILKAGYYDIPRFTAAGYKP